MQSALEQHSHITGTDSGRSWQDGEERSRSGNLEKMQVPLIVTRQVNPRLYSTLIPESCYALDQVKSYIFGH